MTIQTNDQILFCNEQYNIFSGDEFFDPYEYGICPFYGENTGIYKGYLCEYKIKNNQFYLDNLHLSLRQYVIDINSNKEVLLKKVTPPLNGIFVKDFDNGFLSHIYENVNLKINYTGHLILTKNYIPPTHDYNMSPRDLYDYEMVIKFDMKSGVIINTVDVSYEMFDMRKKAFKKIKKQEYRDKHDYEKKERDREWYNQIKGPRTFIN